MKTIIFLICNWCYILLLSFLRKEVIQQHLPVPPPCYDFTPLASFTLTTSQIRPAASGNANSGGVTGGVYKAREHIHRGIADPRLLAIPASCSRVADCNPNYEYVSEIRSTSLLRSPLSYPL